ncbi:MAG: polyamine aminopropyltransferase [Desulfobacterales bacterium]|nr:polyamine aminopropyltransferase [Desulfobacterales bacterium]
MFATGAAGLVLEYIQGAVGAYILGNSIEQFSIVIGLMLFMMGVAAKAQKYFKDELLIEKFILIEITLAVIGGWAPLATYWAHGVMNDFRFVQYFFVMSIGFLIGLEVPVVLRINEKYARTLSLNIERVFVADYIGSLVGALLWVYVLLRKFPLTESSFILAGVNFSIAVATYGYFRFRGLIAGKWFITALIAITAVNLAAGYRCNRGWNLALEQKLYDDPIVFSKTTPYQHLVMTRSPALGEYRFYINGNLQFSSLDEERYHELLVHPVMALVRDHRRVLVLGGGDGMAPREILKYPDVEEVLLVDLDPGMTELAASDPIFRQLNKGALDDARLVSMTPDGLTPGEDLPIFQETGVIDKATRTPETEEVASVRVLNIDADKFLSKVRGRWNVVIIDLPDPSSVELVKLYSREFYRKVKRSLSERGMMVVQATSPYHARESFLCIKRTIESAGMRVIPFHENVPSFGDWGWLLAWKDTLSETHVLRGIEEMKFDAPTRYLTPEVFKRALVFGKGELSSSHDEVNTLMFPILLDYYLRESWLTE